MEKKIKEVIHLKKNKRFVKQKISGKIFVLMGLAIILAIAAYTFILQSAYTKTALETEISRDRATGGWKNWRGRFFTNQGSFR